MTPKVALITGGAQGIGLSVAKRLSSRPDWTIHIIDINKQAGTKVSESLPRTTFHHADITIYKEISSAFQNAFQAQGQLDFIFANAGVFERGSFYGPSPIEGEAVIPPPELAMNTIDLNLKGAVLTSYLAHHYLRCSPHKGRGANLVITASCAAFYQTPLVPLYGTSKYGVLGLMRNIATPLRIDGIRVNAICPGVIRTSLIDPEVLDRFPQIFVDVEMVSETVVRLVDGGEKGQGMTDAWGKYVPSAKMFGLAVEICDDGSIYFRDQHEYADEGMKTVFGSVDLSGKMEAVLKDEVDSSA